MSEAKNLIGKEILTYRIENLIGSGGMGSVYLAANKHINYKVAIKVLNENLAESAIIRQKFVREAETLLKLDHPNIVKFLNFYENEDGVFLIMEYVDGITLDDFITNKNGLIVEKRAYEMFSQILDAFAYAHKKGVVHRDIKPANIILTHDNEGNFVTKILDFGIAKIISESNDDEKNRIAGTPTYMSPEQVQGENVDERSDIYSLGVLLHQMLTGQTPYSSTTLSKTEIQNKVVTEPLPRMKEYYPNISDKMQKIVDKATAKDAKSRYLSCNDFRKTLKNIFEPEKLPCMVKYAAATLIALLIGCGWWFWDYNYHTKIDYYKDYVEQWGTPKGIGKADYKHREGSFRFEKRKGKIDRVLFVNSINNIVEHHDSEHTERMINAKYYYTEDGKVNYVEIMDRNNKILYKKVYDENLKTVVFKYADEFGAEMCLAASTTKLFTNSFNNMQDERGRISRYLLSYDGNGYVKRLQYAGFQNVLVSDADGLFGKEYVVDAKGRVVEERFLGYDGTPKANKAGLAIKKFEYDHNDDWKKVTYYAANGELSSDGNGCPVVVLDNDKWGNRIMETYYDGDGNLALRTDIKVTGMSYQRNDEGYCIIQSALGTDKSPCYYGNYGFYSMENEYDANGYLSSVMFKDMDGNLVAMSEGNAIRIMKNDERGNVLETKYLDIHNQTCEITNGCAKMVCEYDSLGNQTSVFHYDTKDSLCIITNGYAGLRLKYNEKNAIIEWTYYGVDNQPCEVNEVFTIKYEYDPRGNEIKRTFYAADKKTLVLNNIGIAGWESKYDDNGNETECTYFDVKGARTAGTLGYASWIVTYNADGYMEELKNLDENGQLVFVAKDRYAGIKYKYDNRGNCTEKYPYDTNGRLIGNMERYQYDSRDNRIETAYYEQNNKPALGTKGYFRIISIYDSRNQEIEQQYYNTANQLFVPKTDNYAMIKYNYDTKGNTVEVAYFNEHEKPVCKKEGYATHKSEYDAMGRIIRQTFYDENGQPTKPSVMVPEGLAAYDKWGNMNYLAAADGHGKLIDNPQTGWAEKRWIYDIKGNLLETAVFNKNNEPCIDKEDDAHKIICTYNKQNKRIEEHYYSTSEDLRKNNFAIFRQKYDEQGKLLEETWFNYLDKAVDAYNMVHKRIYTYDEQGNPVYRRWYKANGSQIGTQKYNKQTGQWEVVNTPSPSPVPDSNWRQFFQTMSDKCPHQASDELEISSITINSNGCDIVLRYKEISKYNISDTELEEYKDKAKEIAKSLKQESGMQGNTRVTIICVDKAKRELFRITY